jgi:hypothetical protein
MPKKVQPAGDYWHLKASTLKVNRGLVVERYSQLPNMLPVLIFHVFIKL